MNRPDTQAKIRHDLYNCIGRFLDTAPEGESLKRAKELLAMVKRYFVRELEEDSVGERNVEHQIASQLVLATVSAAIKRIPTDEEHQKILDDISNTPPPTDSEIEQWKALERRLEQEGRKWWD